VVSTGVRLCWFTPLAVVAITACSTTTPGPPPTSSTASTWAAKPIHVEPANIRRMRGAFPSGYEVSDIRGDASPAKYWGLKPGWTSDPSQCGVLADPAAGGATPPEGLSASGNGGIIYTVVAAAPSAAGPDPGTVDECRHWSMDSGRTTAIVDRFDAPAIEGVPTLGMVAGIRTIVEGGNETDLRASTVVAYLGSYIAFVTVITDPGSGPSELPHDLSSKLLTQAVATLRA
jgi:Domain of unknown function (DUF5642)